MQNVSELKPLFRQYNLPDPESLTLDKAEAQIEELSEAVEAIEAQLEERSEPLEGMTEREFYAWRTRAFGARHVKSKQAEVLEMLVEKIRNEDNVREYVPHPLAEAARATVKRVERDFHFEQTQYEPVRYFTPANPQGIEDLNKDRKRTTPTRVKVEAIPARIVSRAETETVLSDSNEFEEVKAELAQSVKHLRKCLRLLEKTVELEEIALFLEEKKIIKNAKDFLDTVKDM